MFNVTMYKDDGKSFGDNQHSYAYKLTQWAAAKCYNPDMHSQMMNASKIDVVKSLVKTGHHTTLQHAPHYLIFDIENIPTSLVTFGLHMTHPFYNSSQRSGRFCLDIFGNEEVSYVNYIDSFISKYFGYCKNIDLITQWFISGFRFFRDHLDEATSIARAAIDIERPKYAGNKDILARKIAQEQLRVFISTVIPTGLIYSINITTLYSMYKVAWNAPLRDLLLNMVNESASNSDLDFRDMFSCDNRSYVPPFTHEDMCGDIINTDVPVRLINIDEEFKTNLMRYAPTDQYNKQVGNNLDTLFFDPKFTPSFFNDNSFTAEVEVPISTFGQDQRHRTIRRSNPEITGKFYLPKIVQQIDGARKFAENFMHTFNQLVSVEGSDIMLFFLPYGATVKYRKECDIRAYIHAVNKRLCWNAEQTIMNMEWNTLEKMFKGNTFPVGPPCEHGGCIEGNRFCGRSSQCQRRNLL